MTIETYVLEEQNFGEAQAAYTEYAQIEKLFKERREVYRESFNAISSKQIECILIDEMHKLDKLAKQVLLTQKRYLKNRSILIEKIDSLVLSIKQQEMEFKVYKKKDSDTSALRHAKKLFEESLIMRDHNDLTKALEKAYMANECLQALISDIKNKWINKHQSKLGGLFEDMDIIE
ncbi:hypothetical protein MHK_003918 [Candidatus Magnetomorum sp. HK-1]|nr:hypothetical protein MHK_003918 [Candidatus Magnetomorum sp. HK-1]